MTMHVERLPQEMPLRPPGGLFISRQVLPFHVWAPVGPPLAMQNQAAEHDRLFGARPGGSFRTRQVLPFQT